MTPTEPPRHDEFDRHRRRVLWAMPTGLYLIGSRAGDEVNLMTANLVVQVCLEPKLVAVAVEREAVTARLVRDGGAFSVSLLARAATATWSAASSSPSSRWSAPPTGPSSPWPGHAVSEVGPDRLPVLASAAGFMVCTLDARPRSWGATRCASAR